MNKYIANAYADDIARRAERRRQQEAAALREKRMLDALFDRSDSCDDREPIWL